MQLPEPASLPDAPDAAESADFVYDLRSGGRSDEFYLRCGRLTDRVLAETEKKAGRLIAEFSRYLKEEMKETARSEGEYALDLLLLGLVSRRYGDAARRTPLWAVRVARLAGHAQQRWPWAKPITGRIRASALSGFKVANEPDTRLNMQIDATVHSESQPAQALGERHSSFLRLIAWLGATGDFDAEVKRLVRWRLYLRSLPTAETEGILRLAEDLIDWFASEAAGELGGYTQGVERFLKTEHARRGLREDWFFCAQEPVEYHLNMIAAEIMNRGLRSEFEHASRRVVLVPGCMRGNRAARCRARSEGLDLECTACDPGCAVNRITLRMRGLGAQVYIVPHSTGFTRWLNRWQYERDTGVTAVACMLHILPGGLEMRARNFAAQCVPLDYPGCRRHWRRQSAPTALNEERLVQIVSAR
jgi:uncharacterized protein